MKSHSELRDIQRLLYSVRNSAPAIETPSRIQLEYTCILSLIVAADIEEVGQTRALNSPRFLESS